MRYISTDGTETVDLRQAVEQCYGPGDNLYLPERLPVLPRAYFNNIEQMSLTEIAYVVLTSLMGDHIAATDLKEIVDSTFTFPIPLVQTGSGMNILEMFHGPTMAFKDIGARFLAAFVGRFRKPGQRATVLVATTGNTGGAVANALSGADDIDVLVLFPRGTLTRAQLAPFATAGPNIRPIEVGGSIAHCKAMVHEAVADAAGDGNTVVCANTQNILRIIPQVVFFFQAYARLRYAIGPRADGFTVAIPCGNLSNLTSAIIARRMGLPMGIAVAGCNANDDFARVLDGSLDPARVNRTARPTLARAMDSGYPANLPRLLALYEGDTEAMRRDIAAVSIDDETIARTVNSCIADGYVPDPHTATAIAAAQAKAPIGVPVVTLATAHPAKSLDIMTSITGRAIELPLQFTRFMSKPSAPVKIAPTYAALRKYISTIK